MILKLIHAWVYRPTSIITVFLLGCGFFAFTSFLELIIDSQTLIHLFWVTGPFCLSHKHTQLFSCRREREVSDGTANDFTALLRWTRRSQNKKKNCVGGSEEGNPPSHGGGGASDRLMESSSYTLKYFSLFDWFYSVGELIGDERLVRDPLPYGYDTRCDYSFLQIAWIRYKAFYNVSSR